MEKPNAREPTPSRKAHLALGEKLNRKEKTPPSGSRQTARPRKNRPPTRREIGQ
jgi:hypothetical protein